MVPMVVVPMVVVPPHLPRRRTPCIPATKKTAIPVNSIRTTAVIPPMVLPVETVVPVVQVVPPPMVPPPMVLAVMVPAVMVPAVKRREGERRCMP